MKRVPALITALLLTTIAAQPVFAVDAHHPDQSTATAPSADQTIQKMQANTRRMQSQLEQMTQTTDPVKRQQLLQEHMQTMQENMAAGKGMMGGAMMNCPMMDGMMGGGGTGMNDGMMARRLEMMEKRMDMMQMMMQKGLGVPQGAPVSPAK